MLPDADGRDFSRQEYPAGKDAAPVSEKKKEGQINLSAYR
jgi:hypothetical protein